MYISPNTMYCLEDAAFWEAAGGEDSGEDWAPALDLPALLSSEIQHMPCYDYHRHPLDLTVRQDCINWILKVIEFYRFRPVTAYLAVNYLDRFLSANSLPGKTGHGGWPMQLLSVACLSVAAKMEETEVPLLLDLQILEPKFVFDPRTVRRMELVLMSALHWRMRAITPFDFIPNFAATILPHIAASRTALFSRAADLVVSTRRVVDFLKFRPSAIAAATLLCAAEEISDFSAADYGHCLNCFIEWVKEDVLATCCQLINQYMIDTCPSAPSKLSVATPSPGSPVGVLDAAACGSCDSHKSSAAGGISDELPPFKRRRLIVTRV